MNALATSATLRDRRLHALGVVRLRRRASGPVQVLAGERTEPVTPVPMAVETAVATSAPQASRICRLALQTDTAERRDPAIDKMYVALTEAVSKAGLQPVRVCDVAGDASAAVMVFGAAPVPEGVPAVRVLRVDPLAVLHADRDRKRRLWEQLLALGRGAHGN